MRSVKEGDRENLSLDLVELPSSPRESLVITCLLACYTNPAAAGWSKKRAIHNLALEDMAPEVVEPVVSHIEPLEQRIVLQADNWSSASCYKWTILKK